MPNILFASNSISHFPGSILASEAWAYDPNRVPYALETPLLTKCTSPEFGDSAGDEWWFHFKMGANLWYSTNLEPIFEINDAAGDPIFRFYYYNRTTNGYRSVLDVDGDTYTNERYLPMPPDQSRTYDIQLKFTALQATARVYVNEILVEEQIVAIASWEAPKTFLIGGAEGFSGNGQQFYSELIVADGDTRNARLDLLRPIAVGAYENWNGAVASLSDDDPTTGMVTTTENQYQSTVLTPYTGANNISNIVQITTSVRGVNSPTKLQHLIRMSATDYLTSSFDVPFEKAYQITDWNENPATSSPWDASDIVAAEFGFKSIA